MGKPLKFSNLDVKSTWSCVESMTGGKLASTFVKIPGASRFFAGGLITYSANAKQKFAIDLNDGAISATAAISMAKTGMTIFQVQNCLAITGNAGPTANEGQPIGRVYIAHNEKVYKCDFQGNREEIIDQAANFAFNLFIQTIE